MTPNSGSASISRVAVSQPRASDAAAASSRFGRGARAPARYTAVAPKHTLTATLAVSEPPSAPAARVTGTGVALIAANNHTRHIRWVCRAPSRMTDAQTAQSTAPIRSSRHTAASASNRAVTSAMPAKPMIPRIATNNQSDSLSFTPSGGRR